MRQGDAGSAEKAVRAALDGALRNELQGAIACPLPVRSRPRREVTHGRGERIGRPGRHDVTIDASLDEVVGGRNLIGGDHGEAVAEAFVDDEPPWLVEGGNDDRIDLGVEGGKILAVDVAEEPDATALRRRSGGGLEEGPSPANHSSPPGKRRNACSRTSRPLRSISRPTKRNRVSAALRGHVRSGIRSGTSAVIGATATRSSSTPIATRSRTCREPYARQASAVRMKRRTQGLATRLGQVGCGRSKLPHQGTNAQPRRPRAARAAMLAGDDQMPPPPATTTSGRNSASGPSGRFGT